MAAPPTSRPRLRDLGVRIGRFPTGANNAITDVTGVRVGHVTLIDGEGPLRPGMGPVRTGVTAIIPAAGDVFLQRVFAGSFVLNGAGEMTGLLQVDEWGLCETPILLTNTLGVGRVADATISWILRHHPRIGSDFDVVIPVVAECDDSYLNDAVGRHVTETHVWTALDGAEAGPVAEGNVGAGTGMQTFNFTGGIGTSSRLVDTGVIKATVGALVLSNFGELPSLRIAGIPAGQLLADQFSHVKRRPSAGSIVVLIATDAPLLSRQLSRLCKRGALALGRVGGYAANNSGELLFSWSTTNRVPRERVMHHHTVEIMLDTEMDALYEATVDVVEEAVLNAIVAGVPMTGQNNHAVPALPIEDVRELLLKHRT
ncbi:D-aminopeptidase [Minicystis rosea]|nr:D-aminopeptidase [Minicystis rosea]